MFVAMWVAILCCCLPKYYLRCQEPNATFFKGAPRDYTWVMRAWLGGKAMASDLLDTHKTAPGAPFAGRFPALINVCDRLLLQPVFGVNFRGEVVYFHTFAPLGKAVLTGKLREYIFRMNVRHSD